MSGRTIDEMQRGAKYDTVSASIIYAGNDAGWGMEEINEMLVKAGREPMVAGSYTRFLSALRTIRECEDEVKRRNAIREWLCRNETSLAGLADLVK